MRVNGKRPPASGVLIEPETDTVTVDGRRVQPPAAHRYVVLDKPLGVITTAKDESARKTVLDVIGREGSAGHRLFPVGRLDGDTSGVLLLTDDGELSYRLTHPRYKVEKEYSVTVAGVPEERDLNALRRGVRLEDGMTAPARVEVVRATRGDRDSGRADLRVIITEGRHRQVRRMLQAVGHRVVALRRTAFGPLRAGRMKPGEWRVLAPREVSVLRRAAGLEDA